MEFLPAAFDQAARDVGDLPMVWTAQNRCKALPAAKMPLSIIGMAKKIKAIAVSIFVCSNCCPV